MAKLYLNTALEGIRGAIGKWVYKRNGDTGSVGRRGVPSGPPSEAQLAQQAQFKEAAAWARHALRDPIKLAAYQRAAKKRGPMVRPFAVALGDWFDGPVISLVALERYHGHVGDKIEVSLEGDVPPASVEVKVQDTTTSALLEQGAAVWSNGAWIYTATAAVPAGHTVSIEVIAHDYAGNGKSLTTSYP